MTSRVLVVEDEILVALELESVACDLGHEVVGIAPDRATALTLAKDADIALVDVNLRDGETGPLVGRQLAEDFGVSVVFMTANAASLGNGVPGTLGVVSKPVTAEVIASVIEFAERRRRYAAQDERPDQLMLFPRLQA